ncbi:MAG TPA: hypothetical protein VE692_00695 [Nitrososphaera sp.]|nr:hypothetical protein [Nitrososphaera sp.]
MNRKAKRSKSRAGVSKLKSRRRTAKGKSSSKNAISKQKVARRTPKKAAIAKAKKRVATADINKIVRIMGHGQFTVDNRTLKRLNDLDNAIVELVSTERFDDVEFKKKLTELNHIVIKDGKPLDPHEIIKSDIILPSTDLSIDEAKKLFMGEGVIPEI